MKKLVLSMLLTLALVSFGFAQPIPPTQISVVWAEEIVWEGDVGTDHYIVEWWQTADKPTTLQTSAAVYEERFNFPVDSFTPGIQYTIGVTAYDCCNVASIQTTTKYYVVQEAGGACCQEAIIPKSDNSCTIFVKGTAIIKPSQMITLYCQ